MSHTVLLGLMLLVPVAVMALLRINAAMVFLSLCLGEVLVLQIAGDANSFLGLFTPHAGSLSKSTLQLGLLFGPPLITAVFLVLSIHGRLRSLLNIVPALGTAFLGILLAVPLFTPGLRHAVEGESLWQQLARAQALIVGVSAILTILLLWTQRHGTGERESKRRRRR
jgi:hypothetical protein